MPERPWLGRVAVVDFTLNCRRHCAVLVKVAKEDVQRGDQAILVMQNATRSR